MNLSEIAKAAYEEYARRSRIDIAWNVLPSERQDDWYAIANVALEESANLCEEIFKRELNANVSPPRYPRKLAQHGTC